jgi:hypothetical protein
MSIGRDLARDRAATRDVLAGRRSTSDGRTNWLGHTLGKGAATIDEFLIRGASRAELGSARGAVDEHLHHLRTDHGLPVVDQNGVLSFDRGALGLPAGTDSAEALPVVQALERVGRRFQAARGDGPIRLADLVDGVVRECGCARKSVLPSDHCYDRVNDGLPPDHTPMFVHAGRGLYRFLGPGYPYTGPRYHHPKGRPPVLVGVWVDGRLTAVADRNLFPDELPAGEPVREGAARTVTVNAYERDPAARARCIAHHGTRCGVCGMAFGERYGPVAAEFIHVHHLRPLAEVGAEHEVDPVADLRPVCPNCHAVLHLRTPAYSIEEARGFLRPDASGAPARPTPRVAGAAWRWEEGAVDRADDHLELTYGDVQTQKPEAWVPVARVSRPQGAVFRVEFLVPPADPARQVMVDAVRKELDFYLVELGERDPWGYAIHHCGTAANVYSQVHWACFPRAGPADTGGISAGTRG